MDVPTLDGGERHRVGVLETKKGGEETNYLHQIQKDTHVAVNDQNNNVHSLTDSIKPLTMERHSQQQQNH